MTQSSHTLEAGHDEQWTIELPPISDENLMRNFGRIWNENSRLPTLKIWLINLLTDEVRQKFFAAHSYKHANGFYKLLIHKPPDDTFHVRLHLWPQTDQSEQNIHDHRFDFWSSVIVGQIQNHIWGPSPSGGCYAHYKYLPRELRSEYPLQRLGSDKLAELNTFSVKKGESYFFDKSLLHTLTCEAETITLLLEDRRELRKYANVYTDRYIENDIMIPSPPLSLPEFRVAIKSALKLMAR